MSRNRLREQPHRRTPRRAWRGVLSAVALTGMCAGSLWVFAESPQSSNAATPDRESAITHAVQQIALEAAMRTAAMTHTLEALQGVRRLSGSSLVGPSTMFVVNGASVALEEPIIVRDHRPLVPLREAAAALYYTVIDLGGGTFRLISPKGKIETVQVTVIEQRPVVTLEEWKSVFAAEAVFDESRNLLTVSLPGVTPVQTSLIEKPQEQLAQEHALAALAKRAQADETGGPVPEAARPTLDLQGRVSYTYLTPHIGTLSRSVVTSLSGKAFDFDVRGETVRRDLGGVFKHDYTYLNFSNSKSFLGLFDQSVDLYPLRGQSQTVTGAKMRTSWDQGRYATTFAGGTTEQTVSGTTGSVKYLGQLYEARGDIRPVDWLKLKGGLFYIEQELDLLEQARTSHFPRENVVSFTGAELTPIQPLSLFADVARSDYRPDNEPDAFDGDWNWRTGMAWNTPRSQLGGAYEFVGNRYASLGNPASYQDYRGWNVYGNYRPTDRWSLSSNAVLSRNNVDDLADRVTTSNQGVTLSSSYRLTDTQMLNLSASRFLTNPDGPNPGSSSRSRLYHADYFVPFFFDSRLVANYQYFRNEATTASDTVSHTIGTSLFKSYAKGSSWYLSQTLTKAFHEAEGDNLNWTTALNLDQRLTRDTSLYVNTAYTRNTTDQTKGLHTLSGSTGLRFRIFRDTDFRAEYSVSSYDINTERWRWPRNWSLLCFVSQAFSLATPPAFGEMTGRVFEDVNADGVRDSEEPWVPEATLRLADGREAVTDAQGRFLFRRVVPGRQDVSLDLASLGPEWTIRRPAQTVEVERRKTAQIVFPLVQAASIGGSVFMDENRDGVLQSIEEPVEHVTVLLLPGEQFRQTNADGEFRFDNLFPGHYTLKVYQPNLPTGYELLSGAAVDVEVSPGQQAQGVNFTLRLVPAPDTQE